MTEMVCEVCPKGCKLTISDNLEVSGNSCEWGGEYGKQEALNPVSIVTGAVKVEGGEVRRCPVKTRGEIPKSMTEQALRVLGEIKLKAPVEYGQIVVADLLGTGVDVIAARAVGKY